MAIKLATHELSAVNDSPFRNLLISNFETIEQAFGEVDLRTLLAYADNVSHSAVKNSDFLTGSVDPWVPNTAYSNLKVFELNHEHWLGISSTKTGPSTGAFTTLKMTDDTQHLAGLMQNIAFKIRCDAGGTFELHAIYHAENGGVLAEQSLKEIQVTPWRATQVQVANMAPVNATDAVTMDMVIRSTSDAPVNFAITNFRLTELPAQIDDDLLDRFGDYQNTIKNSNFWNGTTGPWQPNTDNSQLSITKLNGKSWLQISDATGDVSTGAYMSLPSVQSDNHIMAVPQDISLQIRCDAGGIFEIHTLAKDADGKVVEEHTHPFTVQPWRLSEQTCLVPGTTNATASKEVSMDVVVRSLESKPVSFAITDIHMAEHATTEPTQDNLLQNASLSDDTAFPFTPNTDHSKLNVTDYNGRRWLQVSSDSDGSPSIGINYVIDYDQQEKLGLIHLRNFNQKFAFSINDLVGHDYLVEALDQAGDGSWINLRTLQRISITPFVNHRITVTVPQVSDTNVARTIIVVRCVQNTNTSFMLTDFVWNDEVQPAPDDGKALIVPPKIPMVEGHETRVFLDNIFQNGDYYKAEKMIMPGTADAIYAGAYHVTPTAASTNNTQYVQYYRGQYPALMAPLNFVKVPANAGSGKNVKVMLLGESTTEMAGLVNGFYDLTDADVLHVTGIGTRGTAPRLHEGRSGWTTENYMHDATALNITNSFYNPTSKLFDFAYYIGNNKLEKPDYVLIDMGINDSWQEVPLKTTLANYKFMIDSIHWLDPNIKIIIGLTNLPEKFKNMWDFNFGLKDKILNLINALITTYGNRESEGYFLNPIYLNVDPYWDMQYEERVISPDGKQKELVGTNGVHPSDAGFKRCADVLYATLKYAVSL
ncbi:hypothetical protein HFM82_11100 [Lactobacillus plantarum]|uniref:SGNH/GDSL hydrolase family protein n=1 Tax=Lactiplantibacillus plantarum TaxID=1590 RepID=UPI00143CD08B|nr:SGNH/GDSL hydrolase family protein [Lactiplantibacillus plantarum]MBE1726914.1 SGNH/GDSL hydrolase family protein [Lactiplantibacillus plantarum]NKI38771.1 hypothetical protein [Lactiplantibacillus plantarum]